MEIYYKPIRHGYVKINNNGKIIIHIPIHKKNDKYFIQTLIKKGQQLLQRYQKHTHITPIRKTDILLFGERVSYEEIYTTYKIKRSSKWNTSAITTLLKTILKEYATPIITTYTKILGVSYQKLSIRKTISKRWSCTHDQKISLNLDLVHLPTKYIKYVIIHEVCHLKIKNHSKQFRNLVESLCPNYKTIRKELKKFVLST